MGDTQKLLELLSGNGFATFLLILVGLFALLKLVDSGIEIIKRWRSNASVEEQRKTCAQKFASDQHRLDALEAGQDVLVYGMAELLGHYLHNGNTEEMAKAEQKLKKWLYER